MKAPILALSVSLLAAIGAGCSSDKPTQEECERVVAHIKLINGNQFAEVGANSQAMVRSCRGASTKKTVNCMLAATTKADLEKCEKADQPAE